MIAGVIFVAAAKAPFDRDRMVRYLGRRGCPFDGPTIDFILDVFNGTDPEHHLWSIDESGLIQPLTEARAAVSRLVN